MKLEVEDEIWKDIKDYHNYQISNFGNVKSKQRFVKNNNGIRVVKEKILKPTKRKDNYCVVTLWQENKPTTFLVHRLVAQAFVLNPNPDKFKCVNHIDENPSNNKQSNLEWCDDNYNNNYGGHKYRSATTQSQKVIQYDLNNNFIKEWKSMKEVERVLKINHSSISACCKGKQKQAGGYKWALKK